MRSKKPDIEDVKAQFAGWRRERRGRAIPENLWKAALRLLDRYSSSTICAALGLNGSRFREVREAGKRHAGLAPLRGGRARLEVVRSRRGQGTSSKLESEPPAPRPPAFIQLPSLGVGSSSHTVSPLGEMERAGAVYRLTLENDYGRLSIVTLRRPEGGLLEAVSRWALDAPADADGCRS